MKESNNRLKNRKQPELYPGGQIRVMRSLRRANPPSTLTTENSAGTSVTTPSKMIFAYTEASDWARSPTSPQ